MDYSRKVVETKTERKLALAESVGLASLTANGDEERDFKVKVKRKYNLGRINHPYESITIEVEGEDIKSIIQRIDGAWRAYCKAIVDGKVQ